MGFAELEYQEKGHCAWITMNRPEVKNALSKQMFSELDESLRKAIQNRGIKFIAITGAGHSFSAGLDIKQVGSFETRIIAKNFVYQRVRPFWSRMLDCEKPIMSVVDGPAYGAGAEIALASDIVIASTRSKFAFSGGRIGALCCISGVIGHMIMEGREVLAMNLTGNPLSADKAKEVGLVTEIFPEDQLMDGASKILQDLERVSPVSNSSFKRIRREMIPNRALEVAYRQLFKTITSPDFAKGAEAFAHKQIPSY